MESDLAGLPPLVNVPWYRRSENERLLKEIKGRLSQDRQDVLIFLGAGLSYGVSTGRGTFEDGRYEIGARFPGWHLLIRRMHERLKSLPDLQDHHRALERFFQEEGPLDCAELFREKVGMANYFSFLKEQFGSHPDDRGRLSRSHLELVKLPIQNVFTTNYDELIELAYRTFGQEVKVSVSPEEFLAHQVDKPRRHIIKIHGSIDRPDTIVLARTDYARSRRERAEMFYYLAQELRYTSFLFVGFSLLDPNFGLLHDEARIVMKNLMPVSYVVQGSPDVVKEAYLRAMGVNTISLDWWEDLPQFLYMINPLNEKPMVV